MEKYNSYKDSGIQWLGKIPSHWEIKRSRLIFDENVETNSTCNNTNQLQFRFGTIEPKKSQEMDSDLKKIISKYTIVQNGDIMINGLNLNYDFVSQRVAQVKEKGIITSAYIALRPKENICSDYFTYLLKGMDARKVFHGMGCGVRLTLSFKEFRNELLPIPPLEEQQSMATYLDKATAEIDKAIAQQQRMIDLLNERKQIIIQRAVTKGLDGNVEMKNSGLNWLGQIPSHWESLPLTYVFEMRNGYTPSKNDPTYWTNGSIPWYRMEDIRKSGRFLREAMQYVTTKAINGKGTFKAGSYIMAICTASIGEHAMLIADSLANQRFANFTIRKSLIESFYPLFLFYYMYVVGDFCRENSNSTCFQYVDMGALKRFPIPKPSMEEQKNIVSSLTQNLQQINTALERIQKQITLLQERKQIIISEVVTGKIKVS